MAAPVKILAIDSGKTTGWALFVDKVLVGNGHCLFSDVPLQDDVDLVVVETPVYYPAERRVGSAKSLIAQSYCAGVAVGAYYSTRVEVLEITAQIWKGTTDKDISHDRIVRLLSEEELKVLKKDKNARDAAGIGLWKVGRYRRWARS